MTKKRDRYLSGFDNNQPGVSAASYDLMLALWMIEKYLKDQELLRERVSMGNRGNWTLAQLLEVANDARRSSIEPALSIYQRLQQNAEAAQVISEAYPERGWASDMAYALAQTLNNKQIVKRSSVSEARRENARRARESEASA